MNPLVGYGSSDEEEDDEVNVESERPAKIVKTHEESDGLEATTVSQQAGQHTTIVSNEPAPGPSAVPTTVTASPIASAPASAAEDSQYPPLSPYTFERQRMRELTMPTVANFEIPDSPAPPARNSEDAAELAAATKKFERFLELKAQGVHFNERLQNSSSLRNPALLSKLLAFAGVSQEESYTSSLPSEVAVPAVWPGECYVENLLKQNDRKEKKRLQERDRLDFVPPRSKT